MASSVKVGSFAATTAAAGNTQQVTGIGFTPKAIIFFWSGRTEGTDTVGSGNVNAGVGFWATGSTNYSINTMDTDAADTTVCMGGHHNNACISISAADANAGALRVTSVDTDSFTLTVTTQMTIAIRVGYMAIGGDDITDTVTGNFTSSVALVGDDQDITSAGFKPDFIMVIGESRTGTLPVFGSENRYSIGFAIRNTADDTVSYQYVTGGANDDASTQSEASSYGKSAELMCHFSASSPRTIIDQRAEVILFLSTGFRLNWLDAGSTGAFNWSYLAIKGGKFFGGDLLTTTGTGNIAEEVVGFLSRGGMCLSHAHAQSTTDTPQTNTMLSLGAFSRITDTTFDRVVHAAKAQDTSGTPLMTTLVEFDNVYGSIVASTDAIDGLMDVESVDTDGVIMDMTDGDAVAAFVAYFVIGDSPSVATANPVIDFIVPIVG